MVISYENIIHFVWHHVGDYSTELAKRFAGEKKRKLNANCEHTYEVECINCRLSWKYVNDFAIDFTELGETIKTAFAKSSQRQWSEAKYIFIQCYAMANVELVGKQ